MSNPEVRGRRPCIAAVIAAGVAAGVVVVVLLSLASGAHAAGGWRLAGAEFNPVRTMPEATSFGIDRDEGVRWLSLSGTARFADEPGRDEIAVPIAWSARRGESDVDVLAFELDLQYRRFLSGTTHGGGYAGPLLRVAHRQGHERRGRASASAERLGIGVVLGLRLPISSEHHWDLSFSHGRFIGGGPAADAAERTVAATAIDDVFTDRAVLRLVRRF